MKKRLVTLIVAFAMIASMVPAALVYADEETYDLTGPQSDHQDGNSIYDNNIEDNVAEGIANYTSADTKTFRLGTSSYSLELPESYVEGELSEEDVEDGMVAYIYSPESELDFDVYEFGKIGLPDNLAKLASEVYNATEVKPHLVVNGIPVACSRSVQIDEDREYDTITYFMDNGHTYVEVVFWLGDDAAEEQAEEIISTLSYDGKDQFDPAAAGAGGLTLEGIIETINETDYDIIGLFDQIADLVEIFINDGETETVGNIIRAVGDLVSTIIKGDDTSKAGQELARNLILDEDSLSHLSSGAVLDIYEGCQDELIKRGIVVAE